jgi:trehalose/maltose hydrolase-like predicted phosphorylase
MRARVRLAGGVVVSVAILLLAAAATASAAGGSFLLTARDQGKSYAPTFTGNGLLGARIPATGQGYAGGTVPAQSELAGFYARPSKGKASQLVQQRANIPTWSTLTFSDGRTAFSTHTGTTSGWRQSIDLHTGIVSTTARWKAPNGHVTDLSYQVFTDRAREHVAVVQLVLVPHWSGTATVSDVIDGTADTQASKAGPVLTSQVAKGWNLGARSEWVAIAALGTGILTTVADQLATSPNVAAPVRRSTKGWRRASASD